MKPSAFSQFPLKETDMVILKDTRGMLKRWMREAIVDYRHGRRVLSRKEVLDKDLISQDLDPDLIQQDLDLKDLDLKDLDLEDLDLITSLTNTPPSPSFHPPPVLKPSPPVPPSTLAKKVAQITQCHDEIITNGVINELGTNPSNFLYHYIQQTYIDHYIATHINHFYDFMIDSFLMETPPSNLHRPSWYQQYQNLWKLDPPQYEGYPSDYIQDYLIIASRDRFDLAQLAVWINWLRFEYYYRRSGVVGRNIDERYGDSIDDINDRFKREVVEERRGHRVVQFDV